MYEPNVAKRRRFDCELINNKTTMSIDSFSSRGSLPKRLRPFAKTNFNRSDFELNWSKVVTEIRNIFHNKPLTMDYTNIFGIIRGFHREISAEIFDNLRKLCLEHVNSCAPELFEDKSADASFLDHINNSWNEYCRKMQIIRRLFMYPDHKYWSSNPNSVSFWDMVLHLWRDMFISTNLLNKIIVLGLHQVFEQRNGNNQHLELTKSIVNMLKSLELYSKYWEHKYMEEARHFYSQDCEHKLKELHDVRYLKYVTSKLNEENTRSIDYLVGESMHVQFRDALINIILKPQLDSLLTKFFSEIMKNRDLENLRTLYNITELIYSKPNDTTTGIICLRNHFKSYIMKVGHTIVENPNDDVEKDKKMTQELLDLKDNLDKIVVECFKGDSMFHKTVRDCFENFVNSRPNKPAEYLAKFLDSKLRSGNKNLTEEAMEIIMDKVMTLFRFITGKDVFEAFYLKDLAKRLLMGKSACVDTEKAMLEKLKQECGNNYTRKMEVMFSDIENSQRLSRQFNTNAILENVLAEIDNDSPYKGIEMSVHVICNATWPTLGGCKTLNMPPTLLKLQEAFSQFYNINHTGRKLLFEPHLGTCVVRAYFPKGRKELQVSEFQCMVLMQFNEEGDVIWTYKQLEDSLKIDPEEMKKTILSLSVGKGQKVLTKKPMTTVLEPTDVFSFNENFQHKLTKIKFNQIQTKETKEEQQATEEQVFIDRQSHLDCYIVRLMKSHKKLEHTALVTEIFKELRFPVKGSDIKKRIEHLIERDFMSRDASNPGLYHYVA